MMFELTRREQYWAAQEKAAELLVSVACTAIKAQAEIQVAEAQSDASELKALRAEVTEMRQLLTTLAQDAARYRWIRRPDNVTMDTWVITLSDEKLDKAIDAAMAPDSPLYTE